MITTQGHPMAMVRRARTLREADWSYARIADLLNREFEPEQPVNKATVYRWTGQTRAAAHAERERARKLNTALRKSGGALGAAHHTAEYKLARVAALRSLGLDPRAVSVVMTFDYGEPFEVDEPESQPPPSRLERCLELKALPGMTNRAIASLLSVEFGDQVTRGQVRYAVDAGRWPRSYKARRPAAIREESIRAV